MKLDLGVSISGVAKRDEAEGVEEAVSMSVSS